METDALLSANSKRDSVARAEVLPVATAVN